MSEPGTERDRWRGVRRGTPRPGARAAGAALAHVRARSRSFRRRYLLRLLVRREIQARYAGHRVRAGSGPTSTRSPGSCTFYFVFGLLLGRGAGPGELRHPPVRRHGAGPLLHRDGQRRHPLAGGQQGRHRQDVDAARDVPGGLACWCRCWHTVPQLIILLVACLLTGWWAPDRCGCRTPSAWAAALLGLVLMMVFGTALRPDVLRRQRDLPRLPADRADLHQHDPVHRADDVPLLRHRRRRAASRRAGRASTWPTRSPRPCMLIQRGFWIRPAHRPAPSTPATARGACRSSPTDLFTRGFIMLGIGLVLLVARPAASSPGSRSRVPERL